MVITFNTISDWFWTNSNTKVRQGHAFKSFVDESKVLSCKGLKIEVQRIYFKLSFEFLSTSYMEKYDNKHSKKIVKTFKVVKM